jgi:alpha-tubulin N-acetyltransferase 1
MEMKPLSVLDFFVDATVQRGGHGRALFDNMLAYMNSSPALIAYDRPSHKLMGFLAKHFNLRDYVPQNNNYVVFDDYFTASKGQPASSKQTAEKNDYSRVRSDVQKSPEVRQSIDQ